MRLADGLRLGVVHQSTAVHDGRAAVCLRPHHVRLLADENHARELERQHFNLFAGLIKRQIYFGDSIDYAVEITPATVLRVISAPGERFQNGQNVFVAAHPEHCVVVAEE